MSQKYKISIVGVDFSLGKEEIENILTEKAFCLAKKVIKQGGELSFGVNSIKPEILQNV